MDDLDPSAVADLLPPMAVYQQISEIARLADEGDENARRFILWFASPSDQVTIEVPGSLDFEDASRAVALFTAARAASYEMEHGTRTTLVLNITVDYR